MFVIEMINVKIFNPQTVDVLSLTKIQPLQQPKTIYLQKRNPSGQNHQNHTVELGELKAKAKEKEKEKVKRRESSKLKKKS